MKVNRVVISGGGTGGHIFPALAIADEIKKRNPQAEILFVGALGKMEMEKVPAAGYKIIGLPIVGLQRKLTLSNFALPFKLVSSLYQAYRILKRFKPDIVVGVGGYASGPTLRSAISAGMPTLIQEQNSFPGKTNKLLADKVNTICTAYDGMEKFFPKNKVVQTGNPVRSEMVDIAGKRAEALTFFGLDPNKKTILVVGGSLGARTLNESVLGGIGATHEHGVQVLWQCGKVSHHLMKQALQGTDHQGIHLHEFITRMDLAYAAADIIISRAGAIAVSELCLVQKPAILVPSPNVAEDHQTKNAMALVEKYAAVLVSDAEARAALISTAVNLLQNPTEMDALCVAMEKLARPDATRLIVDELENILTLKAQQSR
jgi:UDP-N-acetylglucosamine--N-acetylmuramyl-(pentapeptide) pyrophosphoryl-undecaprenol N-acetylglucosamine transferase